jgi:hypothetical protein
MYHISRIPLFAHTWGKYGIIGSKDFPGLADEKKMALAIQKLVSDIARWRMWPRI